MAPRSVPLVLACAAAAACTGTIVSDDDAAGPYLPATVRRLTLAEYDTSVADLLGTTTRPSERLAADVRQSGFTANLDQRVDGTLGHQLLLASEALADEAVRTRLASLVPCATTAPGCDREVVTQLATRGFRRPPTAEEVDGLLAVFAAGQDGGTFADGVAAVISAVLQSGSFLYLSEVGVPDGAVNRLDGYETASVLAYFLTGGPPDQALLAAAARDELRTPDQREAHARRLLAEDPRARAQLVRFVREWLGIDALDHLSRTADVDLDGVRPAMKAETEGFVAAAVAQDGGELATLLAADFTVADDTLRAHYGLPAGDGRVSLAGTPRRGLLAQAAYLTTYAHETYSSPVTRGVTVIRRLFCQDLQIPSGDLGVMAMQPLPRDPNLTTRQRFAAHTENPACRSCHERIDSIGFAFEEFDHLGRFRATENGQPVDSTGTLRGTDVDGPYLDAAGVMTRIAASPSVARCFAGFVFRFGAATSAPPLVAAFTRAWEQLPPAQQRNLLAIVIAYVRSDLFVTRSVMP